VAGWLSASETPTANMNLRSEVLLALSTTTIAELNSARCMRASHDECFLIDALRPKIMACLKSPPPRARRAQQLHCPQLWPSFFAEKVITTFPSSLEPVNADKWNGQQETC
jgi:hypothetical protein